MPRLVIATERFPTDFQPYVVDRFLGLLALGWDVRVACQERDRDGSRRVPPEVVEQRAVADGDLATAVVALKPDLVHAEFAHLAPALLAERGLRDRPFVASFHSVDGALARPRVGRRFYRRLWIRADAIHCVSAFLWRRVRAAGCPRTRRRLIAPPSFDAVLFDDPPRIHAESLGHGVPLRIASIGRLHWKKGGSLGLDAVGVLRRHGVDCSYRIVGGGPERDALEQRANARGLAGVVEFAGPLDQPGVRDTLRWADVLLMPSVSEGFGLAAIEAQAMGVPVVCTDAGGLSEAVLDGETGLVAPVGNPEALAVALAALARTPDLRQRLADRGRERAHAEFGSTAIVPRFDALYRDLLRDSRIPAG
jgi:colanic acid/amylovoran biosynthesis glycosyltransferase